MGTVLALLFSALKFGKVGGTILTMLVSLAVYAGIFGGRYAAGFIGLMLVHEMGHSSPPGKGRWRSARRAHIVPIWASGQCGAAGHGRPWVHRRKGAAEAKRDAAG